MIPLSVQSLPLHKPIILKKDCSLRQAALAMKRNNVGSVLVTDGKGALRGLFTDRDLAFNLALSNKSTDALGSITHHALLYVRENDTLFDVIELMKECGIRRVPVVHESNNGKQKCVGVITLDDLIRERLIDPEDEVAIIRSQIQAPKKRVGRRHLKTILHSHGRREHSLATFMKNIETHVGLNKTKTRDLTSDVLIFLLHRLGVRTGKSLLSQLPKELQNQLAAEVSPPDHSLTATILREHLAKRFSMSPEDIKAVLPAFWKGVESSHSFDDLGSISRELPKDIAKLFGVKVQVTQH